MTKKNLLLGVMCSVLMSCATAQTPAPLQSIPPNVAAYCPAQAGGTCQVNITVGDTCKPVPEVLQVEAGVTIIWKLAPSDWEFDANGIEFKDVPKADKAFEEGRKLSGQVWQWKVRTAPPKGLYDYNIRVRNKSGRTCIIDPGIWI